MPYNTRNPIKSTLNTGTNLSGIVSFMNTSLFHLARGIKLTFHFGKKILNMNEEIFKEDDRETCDLIVLLQFKFKHMDS